MLVPHPLAPEESIDCRKIGRPWRRLRASGGDRRTAPCGKGRGSGAGAFRTRLLCRYLQPSALLGRRNPRAPCRRTGSPPCRLSAPRPPIMWPPRGWWPMMQPWRSTSIAARPGSSSRPRTCSKASRPPSDGRIAHRDAILLRQKIEIAERALASLRMLVRQVAPVAAEV